MEKLAKPLAIIALVLTIGPPTWMFLQGISSGPSAATSDETAPSSAPSAAASPSLMTDDRMKFLMAVGAILWFVAAPYWLKEDKPAEEIIEKPGLQAVP
jgi:hypothetical protein